MPLIAEYWLWTLLFCKIHLLGRVVFWWSLLRFYMYIIISSANIIVLLPPSNIDAFYLFFVWFLWLKLPVLCWIRVVKVGTLVLFLILRGKFLDFALFEYDVGSRFLIYGLYYVEVWPPYSHLAEYFYHKWELYLIKWFSHICWYDHVIFVFAVVYVYYVCLFPNIVPSLHPWVNPTVSCCMIF